MPTDDVVSYLNKEISKIMDLLFIELKENNIDIKKGRTELKSSELNTYLKIYHNYENKLANLKTDTIKKYKLKENIDYAFGIITNNIVNNKLKNL